MTTPREKTILIFLAVLAALSLFGAGLVLRTEGKPYPNKEHRR